MVCARTVAHGDYAAMRHTCNRDRVRSREEPSFPFSFCAAFLAPALLFAFCLSFSLLVLVCVIALGCSGAGVVLGSAVLYTVLELACTTTSNERAKRGLYVDARRVNERTREERKRRGARRVRAGVVARWHGAGALVLGRVAEWRKVPTGKVLVRSFGFRADCAAFFPAFHLARSWLAGKCLRPVTARTAAMSGFLDLRLISIVACADVGVVFIRPLEHRTSKIYLLAVATATVQQFFLTPNH
eukprot:scaffold8013_cov124-Isochrysis_galbana.AAC.2